MSQTEAPAPASPATKGPLQSWPIIALIGCGFVIVGLLLVIVLLLIFRGSGGPSIVEPGGARISELERVVRVSVIEAVLVLDRKAHQEALAAISPDITPAAAISAYVTSMKALNMEECPPEFREAFRRHINAWESLALQLAREPQSFGEGVLQGLLNSLNGELDGGSGRMQQARDARVDALLATWGEVEAIAARYGARLPSN